MGQWKAARDPSRLCAREGCGAFPTRGSTVCRVHGSGGKTLALGHARDVAHQLWGAEAPLLDAASGIMVLAAKLIATVDYLGARVEADIEAYDHPDGTDEANCPCCGRGAVDRNPFTQATAAMWTVVLSECRQLLSDMVKLGLVERMVAVEESKTRSIMNAIEAAFIAAGVEPGSEQMEAGRLTLLRGLKS